MPSYGVFEDDNLITGHFTDLGTAEDHRDALAADPALIYGDLEALEICDDHQSHPYGRCEEAFQAEAEHNTEILLARVLNGLEKAL